MRIPSRRPRSTPGSSRRGCGWASSGRWSAPSRRRSWSSPAGRRSDARQPRRGVAQAAQASLDLGARPDLAGRHRPAQLHPGLRLAVQRPSPTVPEGTPNAQREQLREQQEELREEQLEFLYPENLVSNLTPGFPNLGAPIALILGALTVGSEYGWTTFKTVLTQRPGRYAVFFGKLLALGIVLALLVLLTFTAAAASSFIVAGLEGAPPGWPAPGELARALGAGSLILAVWAALGVLLAT